MIITRIVALSFLVSAAGLGPVSSVAAQVPFAPSRAIPVPPVPAQPPSAPTSLWPWTLPDRSWLAELPLLPDLSLVPEGLSLIPEMPPQAPEVWLSPDGHFAHFQEPPSPPEPPFAYSRNAEVLYDQARNLIEQNRYDRAIDSLDRLIGMRGDRTDAAMYWKAYSLARIARGADALTTLADMQKRFADSRWLRDARALEVEVRQAAGQAVSAESQNDEELKLLALRGLMQSNADVALPVIEKMLAGQSSARVKEQALFVLSQSRSPRAREVILGVAKGGSNPDLQLKAIRYLGMGGVAQSGQTLDEIYRGTADLAVKRAILRAFMTAGARDRLLAVAKSETSADLRGEAVQQLGAMRAGSELSELYRSEASADVKRRILQGLHLGGSVDALAAIARSETDPALRSTALRNLGTMNGPEATAVLVSVYASDTSLESRKAVIGALSMRRDAKPLVDLARAEKNAELKKDIVTALSRMRSKEATDYLMELLK